MANSLLDACVVGVAEKLRNTANEVEYYDDAFASARLYGKTRVQCQASFKAAVKHARLPFICSHPEVKAALAYAAPTIAALGL